MTWASTTGRRASARRWPSSERPSSIVPPIWPTATWSAGWSVGSADVEEVISGPQGLLSRSDAAPGLIIDATTISPPQAEQVRQAAQARGSAMLAAPVSGNPKVAGRGA